MNMEIRNFDRAAELVRAHIEKKSPVVLYGDSDMDGVSSVVILKEALSSLGGRTNAVYFPDRKREGYGLTLSALEVLREHAPGLLVVMDCGISNVEEVHRAKEMGFDVLIIDHHVPSDHLPEGAVLVDPKMAEDPYPFKDLCAAGVVWRFALFLLGKEASPLQREGMTELAALASLADMVPREGENEELITSGLATLSRTRRPGLLVLLDTEEVRQRETLEEKAKEITSILGAMQVREHTNEAYELLTTHSRERAIELAEQLLEKKRRKQERVLQIVQEVEDRGEAFSEDLFIFEGDERWELPFLGSAASKLLARYEKPVFLYSRGETESKGSVRCPPGISAVEAMASCDHLLKAHGGHHPAAGFTVPNEHIESFRKGLHEYFSSL